jgi:hypothetical protein
MICNRGAKGRRERRKNRGIDYVLASQWFDMWVIGNWRDLPPTGDLSFICGCCPHRCDEHYMNCLECCPMSRAAKYIKGSLWENGYFLSALRTSLSQVYDRSSGEVTL